MVVLHTLRAGRDGTTFVHHMRDGAAPEVRVRLFSWPTALLGRYDVLHMHWPEHMVRRRHPVKAVGAALGFVLLMTRTRRRGTPVVRTQHNLEPHRSTPRPVRWLTAWAEARTDAWVHLNPATPARPGAVTVTIPHGHLRDQFAAVPRGEPVPGRLLHIGLIEPYKGVDLLLEVMARWPRPDVSLHVVGLPSDARVRAGVEAAAAADPRVTSTLRFVPDDEMVLEITRAQLVVLPYRRMHNSGMVLVALSLDRPVLVPRTPVNEALAAEVGPGWVLMYDGVVDVPALERALRSAQQPPASPPRFEGRDWASVGERHYQLYLHLLRGAVAQASPVPPPAS